MEGVIYTIVDSNGAVGTGGDNGNPLLSELRFPQGVAVSATGDVYISDVGNSRIQLVTRHPLAIDNISSTIHYIDIYPNPSSDYFNIQIVTPINEQANIIIENVTGTEVYKFKTVTNQPLTIQTNWPPGMYFVSAVTAQQTLNQKIIIQ